MKYLFAAIFTFTAFIATAQTTSLVDFVNPLMGSDSKPSLSNGNTYPAIGVPWGMNVWSPQTGRMGDGWMYTYAADKIRGFKQTHQPSPWMNDYGQFSIMPIKGLKLSEDARASWFSHKAEISRPYYYSVYLADHDITTEITPTERAAQFRFTFSASDSNYIIIDAFDKGSFVKIIQEERKVVGYTTRHSRGKYESFKNYFVIQFDKDFTSTGVWNGDAYTKGTNELQSNRTAAVIGFKTRHGEKVGAKIASSFISDEQAALNLKREIGADKFEQTQQKAKDIWNTNLSKIKVEGGTEEQVKTFYSCLYRALFFPNKLYELNAQNEVVHWSPYNSKTLPGYMFAGTGFWDTFRALYPFLNLVYPSINKEMQEGLINDYKEGGWLPEWSSPGYADIMIGNNSASVVADAYIKGGKNYDISKLYEALQHGAANEGPIGAVGRLGVKYYNSLGYVPYNVKINENAARTLEYAFDDFSIFKLAQKLNRPQSEIEMYAQRSLNYRNVFDKVTTMMRGRNLDGSFQSPFNPQKWGDAFTEGNSWHYTWSVFHDINGLANLMGGKNAFVNKLDSVFLLAPTFDDSYYGGTIHEIREMQIANMGQYAHGNQPIQHMIYLYNYAGQAYKTQYWVREAMNRLYKPTPDGYCGDEDNGQTSAWYVFSAMGFYPVTPGINQYVLGAPLFKKVTLTLDGGKKFIIAAANNSGENRYVVSQKLNNINYTKTWLSHADILKGGMFNLTMGSVPDKNRVTGAADLPYSFSIDDKAVYDKVKDIQPDRTTFFKNENKPDTISRDGLTLYYKDDDKSFTSDYKKRITDAYFDQYPKLIKKYNSNSPKAVSFLIDKKYAGIAETANGEIKFNPAWFEKNPEDIDVVTHELMHIVQGYGYNNVPVWVTEGIADYVRATEGINNQKANWSMPDLKPANNYNNAYRITARFFVWVTQNYSSDFVQRLDDAARKQNYSDATWKNITGKTLDELWKGYVANPTLK